jgi:hypothetical protein
MRTNLAECPGIAVTREPRAASLFRKTLFRKRHFRKTQGRRGGESESLEEEDIEIGNS